MIERLFHVLPVLIVFCAPIVAILVMEWRKCGPRSPGDRC